MEVSRSSQLSREAARQHAYRVASGRTSSVPAAAGAVTMGAVAVASALAGFGVLAFLAGALGLALLGVVVEDARSAWRYAPRPGDAGRTGHGRTSGAGDAQARPVAVPHQQDGRPRSASPAPHEGGVLRPPVPVQRRVAVQDDQEELLKVVLLDLVAAGTAWSRVSLSNLLSREEDRVGQLLERLRRQEDEARRREAARKLQELAELRSKVAASAAATAPAGGGPGGPGTGRPDVVAVPAQTRPATDAGVTLDEVDKALSVVVRYLAPTR